MPLRSGERPYLPNAVNSLVAKPLISIVYGDLIAPPLFSAMPHKRGVEKNA
jgi:hypothetical protein